MDYLTDAVTDVNYTLVVIENFAEYVKGEVITEAVKVKEILASEWEAHVVRKSRT